MHRVHFDDALASAMPIAITSVVLVDEVDQPEHAYRLGHDREI